MDVEHSPPLGTSFYHLSTPLLACQYPGGLSLQGMCSCSLSWYANSDSTYHFWQAIIHSFIDMPPNPEIPFEGFDVSNDFLPAMDFGEEFCFGGDFSFLPELDVDFFDGFSKSVSHRSQSCYAAARVALVCLWHRFPASLPTCIPPFLSHFIFGTLATKFLKTCRATHL